MRARLDSGAWFRRHYRLPMSAALRKALTGVTEWHLASISIAEILYKWRHRGLPVSNPDEWMEDSLSGLTMQPLSASIARRAALWEWPHGDPTDRIIAATAAELELTLVHTDEVLRELAGFNQVFCRGTGR